MLSGHSPWRAAAWLVDSDFLGRPNIVCSEFSLHEAMFLRDRPPRSDVRSFQMPLQAFVVRPKF